MEKEINKAEVGKILFNLRKERGETVSELASALGISQSAVSMYETGRRIPIDEIKIMIAKHYGVSVGQIFFAE